MNKKNSGGNIMSLKKSATCRLSLLAGSSLIAATLSAAAFTGAAMAPTSALAANECAPVGVAPSVNGLTSDTYTCAGGTYTNGITYSSAGNLTINTSAAMTFVNDGVNLTGNGADSITWNSGLGNVAGGAVLTGPGPAGALIEATSVTGAITLVNRLVSANRAGTTYGIRATSTGGGDISFSKSSQGTNNNIVGGVAAIHAVTNGGDISINDAAVQGYQTGIFAQTSGAGSVSITTSGVSVSTVGGVAAVDVAAGTGGINMAFTSSVNGGAGLAIRAATTGSVTLTMTGQIASIRGAMDYTGVTNGVALTSSSGWSAVGATLFSSGNDVVSQLQAASLTLADAESISFGAGNDTWNQAGNAAVGAGTIDFGTGADSLNVNGVFDANASILNFGAGADVMTVTASNRFNANGATVNFGADNDVLTLNGVLTTDGATFDFGEGTDAFNLNSNLTVASVTFVGLEALNNAGAIFMGGQGGSTSNLAPGDVLSLPGVAYSGSGASRIVVDVNFAAGGQADCSEALAADCLDFTGGTTAGSTLLTVKDAGGNSVAGSSSRTTIVLGATEAGNFTLDPNSDGYVETASGPAVRKRLFDYFLLFDPDAGSYVFAGVPHTEAFQASTASAAAQEIWRSTTGSWFDRQADLRATPGGIEPSHGFWARAGVSAGERDAEVPLDLLGADFGSEVSYSQRTAHTVFGLDVLGAATQNSVWVIGASAGFVRSDVEYKAPSVDMVYAGFSGGLYASWVAGPLFMDATVNANILDVNSDLPSLGFDDNVKLTQTITSVGAQAQAGWRFAVGEAMFAEPLVSVSYVQTELDEIEVPGDAGTLTYDEGAKSLRAGAGLRVGLDSELMGQAASFSLTGRYWNELEGENGTVLAGNAPTLLVDDYSGSFSEVTGSLNLYSSDGGVSGFVNLGGKFADGYQSIDGAVGVRVRW